jgi:hypothetical protein
VKKPTPSLAWRFWGRVLVGNAADCWEWSGPRNRQGYGTIDGKLATRLMHGFMAGKAVPTNLLVCHSCDNPPCVNPRHLWLGTHKDNALDMVAKGRRVQRGPLTHCYHGHEFTPSNTMMEGPVRRCRICRSQRNRIPANRLAMEIA